MDIFQAAKQNSASLQQRVEALLGQSDVHRDPLVLQRFHQLVQDQSRLSVNMRPIRIRTFLYEQRLLSAREQAELDGPEAGVSTETLLRERQGRWYERRTAFEQFFEEGDRFLYGAVNLGNLGAIEYGLFCTVFKDQALVERWRSVYVPGNSLDLYVRRDLTVNDAAVRKDVAEHSYRAHVALLKHQGDIATTAEQRWPAMICSRNCFVEAIFIARVTPEEVEEVRVPEDELQRMYGLVADSFARSLTEDELNDAALFIEITRALEAHNLLLKAVVNA
jgi:hypothetical protein